MTCINGGQGNHGIFTGRPHRHLHLGALQQLKQRLLHRFPADVPCIRILLFGNLINFIDIYDAAFGQLHIVVRVGQQLRDHTLHVIANITSLCQRSGIRDGQRDLQQFRHCLHHKCLAAPRRSQHQHIGFLNLNLIFPLLRQYPLIVVVYPHRENLLGPLLSDYILVQVALDHMRCRKVIDIQGRLWLFLLLLRLNPVPLLIFLWHVHPHAGHTHHIHSGELRHIGKSLHADLVKGLLHAIRTENNIVRNRDHLVDLALRPVAHITNALIWFLVIVLLIFVICSVIAHNHPPHDRNTPSRQKYHDGIYYTRKTLFSKYFPRE